MTMIWYVLNHKLFPPSSPPHPAAVPATDLVAAALPADAVDAAGVASLAGIARLSTLLAVPAYT